jgi:steroid 5-alpha reductase family enzyme
MSLASLFDPGILRTALLPSLQVHTALAVPTYILGRATDHFESKDVLWGSGQVINAWWSAVGRRVVYGGVPLAAALREIGRPGQLLLIGVTVWGTRLAYRVVSRSVRRGGEDDPRYTAQHTASSWNWAPLTMLLPEAIFQAVISLGYTLLFNVPGAKVLVISGEWRGVVEAFAIGLWSAGFVMESLADWQLTRHKNLGKRGLCRDGVWSIVRHPK